MVGALKAPTAGRHTKATQDQRQYPHLAAPTPRTPVGDVTAFSRKIHIYRPGNSSPRLRRRSTNAAQVNDNDEQNVTGAIHAVQQGDSPALKASRIPEPESAAQKKIYNLKDLAKSQVALRYRPDCGIVAAQSASHVDSAQTSDDLPTGDSPSRLPTWNSVDTPDNVDRDEEDEDSPTYPPPKSNVYCRAWLINRCDRGPDCFFFHDDVNYDPHVRGIHPPPQFPTTCKLWKLNNCFLGYACRWMHDDLEYDYPETLWIRNMCPYGYSCDYVHLDLTYDHPPPAPPSVPSVKRARFEEPIIDPLVGQRPPPQRQETCIQWLRGRCIARYACKYRHDDLEYDLPKSISAGPSKNVPDNNNVRFCVSSPIWCLILSQAMLEGRTWSVKVHDHAKVKLGPGFDIQALETGFETPWIYLGNIPAHVTDKEVAELLQPFGDVADVKLPIQKNTSMMLVRARFTTPVSARDASTALHGAQAFDSKITARLPVHLLDGSHNNAMFTNTSVRIRWEPPSRTAYCGYSTMELAEAGMQVAGKVFRDRYVNASIHIGLPVVGVVTIRVRGLPIDVTKEDMAWFAKPDDVVWAQPNYKNFDAAKTSIRRILQRQLELLDFVVLSPPYIHSQVQAWAHFATPRDAKTACGRLHGRQPEFTGKTRISAEHLQSLTFLVSPTTYTQICGDLRALCRTAFNMGHATMSVVERPAPMKTLVKLSGEDLNGLGQLKGEVEKILKGEVVRQDASIAWDPFFAHPAGQAFLENLQCTTVNVTIHADIPKRMIRLMGFSISRIAVREKILAKLTELQAQKLRTIPLDGWLFGQFMRSNLAQLQERFGYENLDLDFHRRCLVVRGNDTVYQGAQDAVHRARQVQLHPFHRNTAVCPVCFDDVTEPVTLPCGHSWCRDCLTHYLTCSVSNKCFPLTCLGKNVKCTEHIPLQVARRILTIPQFDGVVDAAYAAYIQAHSDEFHYCPTPDCPQIYRHAPRDTVLQCPSCLLRICPSCHVEAHDGFACPDPEGDKKRLQQWMKDHDVKPCPGCKVLIERAEGCNHMTCTQCKTHICWVCLQTFPGGNGIYDHMRAAHGGIGLAD
ncbi:hypothetical protein C0991_009049 [Blastosporella zonata]|nr:hypothetical protein C0991_009049 [Blastosporella zonata]